MYMFVKIKINNIYTWSDLIQNSEDVGSHKLVKINQCKSIILAVGW